MQPLQSVPSPEQFQFMREILNEKQWRLYLGAEVKRLGHGGQRAVSRQAGVSCKTLTKAVREIEAGVDYTPGNRVRREGGGRKNKATTDPTLVADLEALMNPKGDPMTALLYTTKSVAHLTEALQHQGHAIAKTCVRKILLGLHYSLKPNKKNIEGASHPDREAQFEFLNAQCHSFEAAGNPVLSIDCKKKELIGNFKNNGREWVKGGRPGHEGEHQTQVSAYDFRSLAQGLAIPYGIYDRLQKQGFVNVGLDHDTAAFAVESLRRWWHHWGHTTYPHATGWLLCADGGGSNGVRNRLFKRELQKLSNELGLAITVAHCPPATSKWNVIEHQLFSFISLNWRATPLTSLAVILELISHTHTQSGLSVQAIADDGSYPIGLKVSEQEMQELNIQRHAFHGEWNYTIAPQILPTT